MAYYPLNKQIEAEIEVFTSLARQRLLEDKYSPGQRLNALLAGERLDCIPFRLFSYSPGLINRNLYDFFFDPVVRFKTTCAQIIRWGAAEVQNATRINSYKIGEALGARLKYSENAAPSTAGCVLKNRDDFSKLSVPDLEPHIEKDIWSLKIIEKKFNDMIGPATTFLYPPFSWAATYMVNANQLLMDLYDNPSFVHELCSFAAEIELKVTRRFSEESACAYFMPDGFCELLSPDQYQEYAIPYMARVINANKNSLFYLTVPPNFRQITSLYQAVSSHKKLICMGSSISQSNPLKNFKDLHEFCTILKDLKRPFQIAINQNIIKKASDRELKDHIKEMTGIVRGSNFMIRTDVVDPETPPQRIDTLIRYVREYGSY